ncbi:hypothetical protein STSP2_00623 [Anaerohalosphaera lusitana]|uniref:Uncharacterized protein n=1 Tax=Anaerohalosphaera lusitana TaxID=1936003 RepID=A0A1U9NIY8_9BACT|nr:hypothetical protein [Anaerohalosphaera lusitana]AQT67476.1 hypothetical protein STSP2_00623 [Anaerohalosphaera lusitana]
MNLYFVVMIGWMMGWPVVEDHWHRRDFVAAEWRWPSNEDHMWPSRLCMVDDLMASGRLDGLRRDEVVELLGPGQAKDDLPGGDWSGGIMYHLGPERGFIRIDSEWLFVEFDGAGIVSDYGLYRD